MFVVLRTARAVRLAPDQSAVGLNLTLERWADALYVVSFPEDPRSPNAGQLVRDVFPSIEEAEAQFEEVGKLIQSCGYGFSRGHKEAFRQILAVLATRLDQM